MKTQEQLGREVEEIKREVADDRRLWELANQQPRPNPFFYLLFLALLGLLVWLAVGCTVIPKTVNATDYSWDGTNRNSGLIRWLPDHSAVITEHARARYNDLILIYGKRFNPPLVVDEGIRSLQCDCSIGLPIPPSPEPILCAEECIVMSPQALAYFMRMSRLRRSGL